MPIPLITQGISEGLSSIPYAYTVLKVVPWVLLVAVLKWYFGGARNTSERLMHSKVVMVTGGTSGIGASVVHELASRGAQVILLTQHAPSDIFLVEYIEDLRKSTGNQLIYAEQVDLSSLHSIRTFATKWIDNAPPRRLDMVILCANTAVPSSGQRKPTEDGLDEEWQVNYLGNFHLLSILSPALRAQPAHRDVRVIFTTCPGYIGSEFDLKQANKIEAARKPGTKSSAATQKKNSNMFGLSKLSLMTFAHTFQKHLNAYKRPDGQPSCTRVIVVDPGFSRTPGTRRWLTGGSLWGLLFYLITWPIWWLILKSPQQGAQTILYAAMEGKFSRGEGFWMLKECREVAFARSEIKSEEQGKKLWEFSEQQIQTQEKESAVKRALAKKEKEEAEKQKASEPETSGAAKEPTPGSRRSRKGK
ncbi:hypothetical protein ASPWEDRAFT_67390 [Aspergillus wentii DTO 134E9]|uniref:Ketoreductase (KR) domain-containing protein n=1 Tax=Aspergillus wentii DTO 134E9 TaxID=1073089 RepID=A0A1L9RQF2_ASPWE|nr:uncharacterized protein ASPWEDRAFT_67390 [Aspergillus wentii DTO 134E9]KAI9928390.1 hypothetical protein MW887_002430 [Aspergillus wentii]OJJ37122.1 hypothetical protein ASPWEDRAFT_67390 [Aspergillus wentii DTO 134E9]